jgi:PIN domain nuclease of toxin-antitoxin system
MSCAELAWAVARRRTQLDRHWKLWFRHDYVEGSGWQRLPISLEIVDSLPEPFHSDPVDRLLVASARIHDLQLITGDEKLVLYPPHPMVTTGAAPCDIIGSGPLHDVA